MIVLITVTLIIFIVTMIIIMITLIGKPWHQDLPPAPSLAGRASSGGPRGLGRPSYIIL